MYYKPANVYSISQQTARPVCGWAMRFKPPVGNTWMRGYINDMQVKQTAKLNSKINNYILNAD